MWDVITYPFLNFNGATVISLTITCCFHVTWPLPRVQCEMEFFVQYKIPELCCQYATMCVCLVCACTRLSVITYWPFRLIWSFICDDFSQSWCNDPIIVCTQSRSGDMYKGSYEVGACLPYHRSIRDDLWKCIALVQVSGKGTWDINRITCQKKIKIIGVGLEMKQHECPLSTYWIWSKFVLNHRG